LKKKYYDFKNSIKEEIMENKQTIEEFLKEGGKIKTFTEEEAKKLKEKSYKNTSLKWRGNIKNRIPPHKVE